MQTLHQKRGLVQHIFHMLHLCNISIMVQEKIIVSHLK